MILHKPNPPHDSEKIVIIIDIQCSDSIEAINHVRQITNYRHFFIHTFFHLQIYKPGTYLLCEYAFIMCSYILYAVVDLLICPE